MDSHRVLAPKYLPVVVDRLQGKGSSIQRIDTHMRRTAGMGASPQELNVFHNVAVAGAANGKTVVAHIAGGVAHHRHVHIVEFTQAYKFLLAAHEFELFLFPELQAPGYFDKLLGGNSERHQFSGQFSQHLRLSQAADGAQHHANLAMVTASMSCPGLHVSVGVLVDYQGVQLTNH